MHPLIPIQVLSLSLSPSDTISLKPVSFLSQKESHKGDQAMSTGKSKKKKMVHKAVSVVDIGCSNCKFPSLSSFFNPSPKKPRLYSSNYGHCHSSSTTTASSSSAVPSTSHWFSDTSSSSATPSTAAVAVEKDSDDPYLDFRQSMLQMILENEIYSKDDLRELLHCFLSLNEPFHHGIIIRAFSEIWDGVFSAAVKRRGGLQESPLVHRHASHRNHYHRSM